MSEEQNSKPKSPILKPILIVLSFLLISALIAIGAFAWRVHSAPLDLAFAKATIEASLRNEKTGNYASVDHVVLHWPEIRGPLYLGIKGAHVNNAQGQQIIAVNEAAIALNKARLLIGQVSPYALILKQPSIRVRRAADNSFSVALGQDARDEAKKKPEQKKSNEQVNVVENVLDLVSGKGENAGPLSALSRFRIEGARVVVDDEVLGASWILPNFGIVFQRAKEGLSAMYALDLPKASGEAEERAARLEGDFLLSAETGEAAINMRLNDFDFTLVSDKIPELAVLKDQNVGVDVELRALMGADHSLRYAELRGASEGGSFNVPEWSAETIAYENFAFEGLYNGETRDINLRLAQVVVGGIPITASGTFNHRDGNMTGAARLDIAEVAQEKIDPIWPVSLKEENAYSWIVTKMSEGVFKDVFAEFEVSASRDEEQTLVPSLDNIKAGFAFDNMRVDYRNPMAPLTKGVGSGTFNYAEQSLLIDVESGEIGGLNVDKARLEFYNIIESGAGTADLNIHLNGPLEAGLRYIKTEPLEVDLDTDIEAVKGDMVLHTNIEFPTHQNLLAEEVKVGLTGTMSDVILPRALKNAALSGGPFDVAIKDGLFSLKGDGKLGGQALKLDYREYLSSKGKDYASRVSATLVAGDFLRESLGIDLSDFLSGDVGLDVVYTKQPDGKASADVKADLTQAKLYFTPFDYEKPAGTSGDASFKVHLQDNILKEISGLNASAFEFKLEQSTIGFSEVDGSTELASGSFGHMVVGQTEGSATFEFVGDVLKLGLNGPYLDLRSFLKSDAADGGKAQGAKSYDNPPMRISINADVMRTSDEEVIRKGKIQADIDGQGRFSRMEMDAVVGGDATGSGAMYVRFKPDETGKRVFRLEADDAGAALKAFDLFHDMRGGKLVVYGEPIDGVYDRNLIGKAEITNFKVVKAPVIAKLLSALSLKGATDMLGGNNEGLVFTKLVADFDWLFKPEGSLLVMKEGSTSGNALGLTFEGTYDNAAGKIDVSGTIVPISGINKMIGNIPLVGDILTGGSGGIFAATYRIRGEGGAEPSVSVNPLSVLAPGIIRRILFESSVDVPKN